MLVKAKAKALIGIGFCGALKDNIQIGDVILPTASARDEDTTDHYASKKMPATPDFHIILIMAKHAMNKNLKVHIGPIVTTSASLKEDSKFIIKWSKYKTLGVDCETSVLYLISYLYNIKAGVILTVSDNLLTKYPTLLAKNMKKKYKKHSTTQ